jgi:hypothetical protein
MEELKFMKARYLKNRKTFGGMWVMALMALVMSFAFSAECHAQQNNNHLLLGVGVLYPRGFDVTLSYEHSSRYHHAWEYFAMGYLQYSKDPDVGHVTNKSFWNNYNSWHLGIAYKPCVSRGRNHHGNLRLGGSIGSNTDDVLGGLHIGYTHSYALIYGWELFFTIKEDVIFGGRDLFRTGANFGIKMPI